MVQGFLSPSRQHGDERPLMRLHVLELTLFSTYAELRAERARSYLGLLWWLLEPAMQMATYYLVFNVVLNRAARTMFRSC